MEENDNITKTISKNLIMLRKNKKLTQLELAQCLNYSDKSISKWENGESMPNIDVLVCLCEFFNIDLNNLINPNLTIEKQEKHPKKLFPAKLIISLLAVSAVWTLATILFVAINIINNEVYWKAFLWAIPISCLVLVIFCSIWYKGDAMFIVLTSLIWSTLACVHIQLIQYNLWIIYILGIPLQIAVILWRALVNNKK